MIVSSLIGKVRVAVGGLGVFLAFTGANPALANSSANTDIAAPLRQAQAAARPAIGATTDDQFRKLFSSWEALDGGAAANRVPTLAVSAMQPSRVNLAASSRASAPVGLAAIMAPATTSIPSRTPLEGVRMTSDFGLRVHPILGGVRAHTGVDLGAPVGTAVYATADGIVGKAEWFGGYGLFVAIEHGGTLETRYGHMSRLNVAAGQRVHKGDIVGFVGTTGRSTGPHLHYEVRVNGVAVNPVPYMQAGDFAQSAGRRTLAVDGD